MDNWIWTWVMPGILVTGWAAESFDHGAARAAVALLVLGVSLVGFAAILGTVITSSESPGWSLVAFASGFFGVVAGIAGLVCAAVYLADEGRSAEIVFWVPLLALAALGGFVLCLAAYSFEGPWRVRLARAFGGFLLIAPAVAVGFATGAFG